MKKKFKRTASIFCSLILLFTANSNAQTKLISFWDFNTARPLGGGTDSLGTRFSYANPFVVFFGSVDSTNKTYPLFANYNTNSVNTSRILVGGHPTGSYADNGGSGGSAFYDYSSNHDYFFNSHPYFSASDSTGSAAQCYIKALNPTLKDTIYMYLPTGGYQNIHLSYAISASSTKAANYNVFTYSTNGGTTWKNLTTAMDTFNISSVRRPDTLQMLNPTTSASAWYPVQINFTSDPSINNNANFILRWIYAGANASGASGNNRYDNFALTGDSLCPSFSLQPTNYTICHGGGNADFVIHSVGGTGAVTYQWWINTGSGFTLLPNGGIYSGATTDSLIITGANTVENGYRYECLVTDVGCGTITSTIVTLTVDPILNSSISSSTNVTCAGLGSATVSVTGGTAPYTYLWNDALHQTTATASSLAAGSYTITTTDNAGCSVTSAVTIANHGVIITLSGIISIECAPLGSATATGSNGIAPYTYTWAPGGATTAAVTGLTVGSYTVTVQDNTGCSNTATVTISTFTHVRDSINGYGIPQVIHYWDFNNTPPFGGGGGDSLGNITNPLPAPYTALPTWNPRIIYTTPAAIQTVPYLATQIDGILDNLTPGAAVNDLHILGDDTAGSAANNLAVRARNPSENAYTYLYLPTNGYQNIQLNYALSASSSKGANYNVFSYSTNGGTTWKNLTKAMDTFNISGVYRPDTLQAINPTTAASNWYAVNINFTSDPSVNNNPNFVVRWEYEGPNTILTSGNDRYDNFSLSGNITTETCNGAANYTAVAGVKYGEGPFTYSWTPSVSTTATASNISAGTYKVTVTDANGCSMSSTITVSQPTLVTAAITSTVPAKCFGAANGGATSSAGGGTPPYHYSWSSGQTTSNITVSGGTYTLTVTDSYGCTATSIATIIQPAILAAVRDSVADDGSCNGLAAVTISGGTPPYTYLWTLGGQTTDTIQHLCAKTYCCTVTDKNGCSYSTCITVISTLGIDNVSNKANISIYPDPSSGNFTIAGVVKGQVIELYDYTGQKINSLTVSDNTNMQFDLSTKANGIYLVRILNKDGSIASENKIVKTQ